MRIWTALLSSTAAAATAAQRGLLGWRSASELAPRVPYRYQDVPLCEMALSTEAGTQSALAQWWNGGQAASTPLALETGDLPVTEICSRRLSRRDAKSLEGLVAEEFWYSYRLNGAPEVRVPIGMTNGTTAMVYAHKSFHVFGRDRVSVVPSAPVPIKADQDLRLTYDVTHYPAADYPAWSEADTLVGWNSLCVGLVTVLVCVWLRWELRREPLPQLPARLPPRQVELLAVAAGTGSQLVVTAVLFAFFSFLLSLPLEYNYYSVSTLLTAFSVSYLANGFSVFRVCRLYRSEAQLSRVLMISLLAIPAAVTLAVWNTNGYLAEVGSTRAISMLRFLFQTAVITCLVFTPLHHIGATLSARFTPAPEYKPNAVTVGSESSEAKCAGMLAPVLSGVAIAGGLLLALFLFNEASFGSASLADVSPLVLLLLCVAIGAITLLATGLALWLLLISHFGEWTNLPLSLGRTTGVCLAGYLLLTEVPKYFGSALTCLEATQTNLLAALSCSLIAVAVSHYGTERVAQFLDA